MTNIQIARLPTAKKMFGVGRSSIYLSIQRGLLPPPVKLGARAVGWPEHELAAVIHARIAGFGDEQIRKLVARLVVERATATPGLPAPARRGKSDCERPGGETAEWVARLIAEIRQ